MKESMAARGVICLSVSDRYSGDRMPERSRLSFTGAYSLLEMTITSRSTSQWGEGLETVSEAVAWTFSVSSRMPISRMVGLCLQALTVQTAVARMIAK